MQEFENYVRIQRLKENYLLCISLGQNFLEFIPESTIIKEEMAIAYYWIKKSNICPNSMSCSDIETYRLEKLKNLRISIGLINEILESKPQNKDLLVRSLYNHQYFIEKIESLTKDSDLFAQHTYIYPELSKLPLITFSITTCRRLSLFKSTMFAFLKNFKDINLICRWICIDDNSSTKDREEMKHTFPFFEYVWKTPEQKGHPKSMQILTSMVNTPYLLHIEDDRVLMDNRHYVNEMLDILESDSVLGQVVFNKNYKETANENICGGLEKYTPRRTLYYEHEHCRTDAEIANFNKRHKNTSFNCSYYPHFSLSPSMINTKIFKTLEFKDELCFEYKFAQRYVDSGFKTAFLPGYYFKHIGRLTSDRQSLAYNAYDLLNTPQFFDIPKYKPFVINLEKRPDRLDKLKQYKDFLPPNTYVMPACDGYMLASTPRLYALCEKCDYQMRPGVIGCALSHLVLYHKLLFDTEVDGYLIFEDDVTPTDMFMTKLARSFTILKNRNEVADLIFFTTVLKNNTHTFKKEGVVKKKDRKEINIDSIGGTGCYYISKNAALTVFEYIEKRTLDVAIDALLFNISHLVETYFVQPCIISQDDIIGISNIQHDHNIKSPLYCENPIVDNKVVFNNEINTNNKIEKIDLFDNIYVRYQKCLENSEASSEMKKLSDMYREEFVYLNTQDTSVELSTVLCSENTDRRTLPSKEKQEK